MIMLFQFISKLLYKTSFVKDSVARWAANEMYYLNTKSFELQVKKQERTGASAPS